MQVSHVDKDMCSLANLFKPSLNNLTGLTLLNLGLVFDVYVNVHIEYQIKF